MVQFLLIFNDWALLILRLVLGAVMIAHGLPKLKDVSGFSEKFAGMGFRPGKLWAPLVAGVEFFGGLALLFGIFVQPVAVLLAVQFLVILLTIKRGKPLVGGSELDLLILAVSLVLATAGGGVLSLDSIFGITLY